MRMNKLHKSDTIKAIINLKTYAFKIDGIVDRPEFIYAVKSETAVTPSAESFGILYIKESTARSVLGLGDTYNQLHVLFTEGAVRKVLIDEIEDRMKPYGFINGVERKDQFSHTMVDNEIGELQQIAYIFPVLFLGVAATIIYMMQRRIISNQRTLIGVMKALGYTDLRILMHYVLYSLLIALAGSIPAIFFGLLLGVKFTELYNQIFSIPVMQIKIYWDILIIGIALSIGFCLAAGYSAAKRVLEINPAQAMRTEAPKAGRRILLEKMTFLWNRVQFGWKMSIRNIFRSRSRTLFTIVGIMATVMFFYGFPVLYGLHQLYSAPEFLCISASRLQGKLQ